MQRVCYVNTYILRYMFYIYFYFQEINNKHSFRLLNIELEKRIGTLMYQYHMFNNNLDNIPFEQLDKLSNTDIKTEVPYKIYIESSEHKSLNFKKCFSG